MNPHVAWITFLNNVSSEMSGLVNTAHYHGYTMAMFERGVTGSGRRHADESGP